MFKRSEERKLTRLKGYDYSQNGYYFVTICTEDMEHRFGRVENGVMQLNKCGEIAKQCLNKLLEYYDNCFFDEIIIMPNHIHAIIIIDNDPVVNQTMNECRGRFPYDPIFKRDNIFKQDAIFKQDNIFKQDAIRRGDEWESSPTVSNNTQYFQNRLKQVNKRHGLGEMIRSFKSNVSREIKQIKYKSTFKWQRSFHDHIIRNEKELYSIRKYIRDNPLDW